MSLCGHEAKYVSILHTSKQEALSEFKGTFLPGKCVQGGCKGGLVRALWLEKSPEIQVKKPRELQLAPRPELPHPAVKGCFLSTESKLLRRKENYQEKGRN